MRQTRNALPLQSWILEQFMRFLRIGVSPRHGLLAILFALLGAAAFPPLGLWPLTFASIAGLLCLLHDRSPREALDLGLVYGGVYALGTMYWFFGIFAGMAIPLLALMAGYFGLFGWCICMTRGQSALARAALVALFAVGIEWVRGDCWYLRFPWYTAPHALAASPPWIAGARWLGVYGLSYVIWLIAGLGAFGRSYYWAAFVLFPVCSLLLAPVEEPDRRALLFQGEDTIELEELLPGVNAESVEFAVLPEYAYRFSTPQAAASSKRGPAELARRLHCAVVFGAVEGDYSAEHYHNVAAAILPDGTLVNTFPKQHPVPLFHDGDPGDRRPVFPLENGQTLGVAICYDFDAPEVSASLVRKGATVLVAPTFDSLLWGKVQHVHHEQLLRLRAVENDRWILRAASSGRTEAINPHGVPSQQGVEIGKPGYVMVDFAYRDRFALGGWASILGPTAAGLSVTVLIGMGVGSWRRRRKAPVQTNKGILG
jgi:apolipoprotein N-acyltransferase